MYMFTTCGSCAISVRYPKGAVIFKDVPWGVKPLVDSLTMDIMMRLKGAGFSGIANAFREREKRLGGGLPLLDFVEIVLRGLPRPKTPEEKAASVSALVDLFEDIDINGDGVMEFEEFTSFCVDAGMVATRTQVTTLKHRYERDPKHALKTTAVPILDANSRGTSSSVLSTGIEKLKWSPGFRMFLVLENAARSVKIFSSDGKFVAEVSIAEKQGPGKSKDGVSKASAPTGTDVPLNDVLVVGDGVAFVTPTTAAPPSASSISVLDAVFIHRFRWLAVSSTDFAISFYDMSETRSTVTTATGPNFSLLKNLGVTTSTAQTTLRFCEASALLVGSGNDFVVNIWKVVDAETKILWRRLSGHADLVMDALEIPPHDLLVSCDLRHSIQLWDLVDGRARGSLSGHERGVRQLCYSEQHDLLLSAGFEYEALAWDLGSRQVVLKLSGHRAPLVGVQLALFQTERAITADCQGIFKVWDITRGNASSSVTSTSQAVQLESIDLAMPSARVETLSFVSMHPHNRDLWVVTSGSCTLQSLRSVRVQQFDEVPLRAFYHYGANKFVVVAGSVCSLWDGETGSCTEEFTNVGNLGPITGASGSQGAAVKKSAASSSELGMPASSSSAQSSHNEPGTELLICAHDEKCRKLVVVSELGALGVFNCQNFVQMRRCQESFLSASRSHRRASAVGKPMPSSTPSCAVVGLHYCSENKLIIATDAAASAIVVIDDNSNQDSTKGIGVLRKLINIPGGIAASAYSFHASMVATIAADPEGMTISLWDFETLALLANCRCDQGGDGKSSEASKENNLSMQTLEFWDEFPLLLAADSIGGVYVFAVMPLLHAYTGKLLHAFMNDHGTTRRRSRKKSAIPEIMGENEDDDGSDGESTADEQAKADAISEAAENAARKMLLGSKGFRKNALIAPPVLNPEPDKPVIPKSPLDTAAAVTCLKVVHDEESDRYLLFVGDERGCIGVWDTMPMVRRLTLAKIPEIKCKYLRRGYQPKAMFFRDYKKDSTNTDGRGQKHRQAVQASAGSDWRGAMLLGEDMEHMNVRASHMDLKRLSRRRQESRARTPQSATSTAKTSGQPQTSAPAKAKETAVVNAVAAAEYLLGKGSSFTTSRSRSVRGSSLAKLNVASESAPSGSWPGSACYESFPRDVQLVRRWQAHGDALTSLELSRHPNIVVTCALDMRVFVWNWDGECLGKLFDPDDQGSWPWRFRKDNATRAKERELLVRDLLKELERSPAEKLELRRQTLYTEHVGRRNVSELRNVNAMLLEHIISKNPEIKLLEQEVKVKSLQTQITRASSATAKLRESRGKAAALRALALLPGKPTAKAATPAATAQTPAQKLRLQSLSQVAPLTHADSAKAEASLPPNDQAFAGELKMDKTYLEDELSITCPTSSSISVTRTSRDADVQQQIHAEFELAQQALATQATLKRKARGMYANLEGVLHRHGPRHHSSETLDPVEKSLEASEFLKRHFSSAALAVRPQTAPVRTLTSSVSTGALRRDEHSSKRLQSSTSESVLPPRDNPTQDGVLRRPSTAVPASLRRRTSLDEVYIEESHRHRQQQQQHADRDPGNSGWNDAADNDKQPPKPLHKLRGINDIIDKAQDFCDEAMGDHRRHSVRPGTAPLASRRSLVLSAPGEAPTDGNVKPDNLNNLKTLEEQAGVLRNHLEGTKNRMQEAMRDGKRAPHRQNLRRIREEAQQKQQKRRMNGYLQQKRRELTTNIGNVFKGLQTAQGRDGRENEEADAAADTEERPSSAGARARAKQKSSTARLASPKGKGDAPGSPQASDPVAKKLLVAKKTFGIYNMQEVMSVIRLFWSMDADGSGNISLAELQQYKAVFEKLGYHNMLAIFQTIDTNGDGQVSLRELLETCFHYATKPQIDGMLQLAKVGSVRSFLLGGPGSNPGSPEGGNGPRNPFAGGPTAKLLPEHRRELMAIFRVFDHNGDGGVSMQEIMEALRVDDDDVMAAVMAREHKAGQRYAGGNAEPVVSSGLTREDVEQIYHEFDRDQDATLDFDEFVAVMRSLYALKPLQL